jgi:hypothetical protein
MSDYRCYPITLSGLIDGPARVLDCIDDGSAIEQARAMLPEKHFEIWQGERKVYTTKSEH